MEDWLAAERRHIADQLQEQLSASGCAVLLGEFRMGKSSALQSLMEILPSPRAYIGLGELLAQQPADADKGLYSQILQGLARDWGSPLPPGVSLDPPGEAVGTGNLDAWFEGTLRQLARQPVTILLDDADRLAEVPWGEHVFRRLSSLVRRSSTVRIVMAGTGHLERWARDLHQRRARAGLWDSIPTPVRLNPISLQAVRDAFPDHEALAQRLVELCGGHLYCLHKLTKGLQVRNSSQNELPGEIEQRTKQLEAEWESTFDCYWQTYGRLTRQICFLLTVNPQGLPPRGLRSKLDQVPEEEFKRTLEALTSTGVLFKEEGSEAVRLIGLFRQWYAGEVGFVGKALAERAPGPTPAAAPAEEAPTLELTFFPDEDLVFIRHGHFLSYSKLGMDADRLSAIRTKTRQVPANSGPVLKNLNLLAGDLWVELKDKPWFQEVTQSAAAHTRLHFNIPIQMGEFPFELLPLDNKGTQRIGMNAPMSRQLFKEGRYVERAPLALPPANGERLRVLVVAAEAGGKISLDADGLVSQGMDAVVQSQGEHFNLGTPYLEDEVQALHRILSGKSDLVGQVTFLTRSEHIHETEEQGVSLRRFAPTAQSFQEVLNTPDQQFDVVHFVGHGLVVRENGGNPMKGGLLFEDRLVHLTELARLLRAQHRLRFVYLSCCESAVLSANERTSDLLGLAHACIEAGVPAVLAMRWRIPVGASCKLAEAFYPALFKTGALDRAMYEAVRQVYDEQLDEAKKAYAETPVLIMH